MFHNAVIYYVPKGVKAILVKFGVSVCRVNEMGWWDEKLLEEESVGSRDSFSILCAKVGQVDNFSGTGLLEKGSMENIDVMAVASSISPHHLRVICTPALHNSGRSLCQMDKTLWATWYLEYTLPNRSLWRCFFGGDTGYQAQPNGPVCPIFKGAYSARECSMQCDRPQADEAMNRDCAAVRPTRLGASSHRTRLGPPISLVHSSTHL